MADTELTGAAVKDKVAESKKLIIRVALIVVTVVVVLWLIRKFAR